MTGAFVKRIGFIATTLLLSIAASAQSRPIDELLKKAVEEKRIPGAVAMVLRGDAVVYQGAFGKQFEAKGVPMTADSIFRIASMTKPVTSVAVMQLVEQGKVKLEEPVATYLPYLKNVQVLEGFDADGKPLLRAPKSPPTVRQLLNHTGGFAYEFFDAKMAKFVAAGGVPSARTGTGDFLKAPLVFDPGTKWEYGINTDQLGKLVETVTGMTLEEYFQQNIFTPLGMKDSFFNVPAGKQARVVTLHMRKDDGTLAEMPPEEFKPVQFMSGGGGMFSTAGDYLKFTRMLLEGGKAPKGRILREETVKQMSRGEVQMAPITSLIPQLARNVNIPGGLDKFGLGFATNTNPVEGGRASGSFAWAGVYNTFFWVDPQRKATAVLMMQLLPFMDDAAKSVLESFEKAVYASR